MKIAFYSGENGQKHASRIIEILRGNTPAHQYNHCADEPAPNLWHCVMPHRSILFMARAPRSVISLSDVRFLTDPQHYSWADRLFRLPLYRYHCRHAARLIAANSTDKRRVVDALSIDSDMVNVCLPLRLLHHSFISGQHPSNEELLAVRRKLDLAESYILIIGNLDTMHDHGVILRAIFSLPQTMDVVIYGRRTTYSDTLHKMVADMGAAQRVLFVYEISHEDLPSLYRMALVMIYMPSFESTIAPIVMALHQGVPMILSDLPLNREAAGRAAQYVTSHSQDQIVVAIKQILYNESFRGQMIAQCWAEARRYSEKGIAEQLAQIYESV